MINNFIGKVKLEKEDFLKYCEELRDRTWHRDEDQDEYRKRMLTLFPNKLENDSFVPKRAKERYNPSNENEAYDKLDLEEMEKKNGETWKFLSNKYYTKYAVSSEGRVAFLSDKKYHVLFQSDKNNDGYLKLDPEGKYNLDHDIEVYKLIAMGFLGKEIGDGYDVHHIINDGYDCRPSNLILLTRQQHNLVHMGKEMFNNLHEKIVDYLNEE